MTKKGSTSPEERTSSHLLKLMFFGHYCLRKRLAICILVLGRLLLLMYYSLPLEVEGKSLHTDIVLITCFCLLFTCRKNRVYSSITGYLKAHFTGFGILRTFSYNILHYLMLNKQSFL